MEEEKARIPRAGSDHCEVKKKKKKEKVCTPLPFHSECLCTDTVFLSFAVAKLPKRWWRQAPKSRGSLQRCTGEWGGPQGAGRFLGWTEGCKGWLRQIHSNDKESKDTSCLALCRYQALIPGMALSHPPYLTQTDLAGLHSELLALCGVTALIQPGGSREQAGSV